MKKKVPGRNSIIIGIRNADEKSVRHVVEGITEMSQLGLERKMLCIFSPFREVTCPSMDNYVFSYGVLEEDCVHSLSFNGWGIGNADRIKGMSQLGLERKDIAHFLPIQGVVDAVSREHLDG